MTKEFVCIVCPSSCRLTVSDNNGEVKVEGATCKRGIEHGIKELTHPERMLTSTVVIENAILPRLAVISSDEIPKSKIKQCLDIIYATRVKAPVKCGDIIIKNISDTGVDMLASQTIKIKENN